MAEGERVLQPVDLRGEYSPFDKKFVVNTAVEFAEAGLSVPHEHIVATWGEQGLHDYLRVKQARSQGMTLGVEYHVQQSQTQS